jgi:hypothetical protein
VDAKCPVLELSLLSLDIGGETGDATETGATSSSNPHSSSASQASCSICVDEGEIDM